MELKELYEKIETTYASVKEATIAYRDIAGLVVAKRREIEMKKAELFEDGMINGKNAEKRDAQVKFYLNEDFETLAVLETTEASAKLDLDIKSLDLEMIRALLRIEEVAAATGQELR